MADLGVNTAYPVHLGFWTNWSHGKIQGATITLSSRNGALLTAFLALFVTFAGTSFWRIACFALHQISSSSAPQDGLYHQQQAILRNSANGTVALSSFIRTLWAWRRRANRPFHRIVPLILFAVFCVGAFAVAGLFSSKIGSAMGNEVLISSPNCGVPYYTTGDISTVEKLYSIYFPYDARRYTSFANYAQKCYSTTPEVEGCAPFIRRQLSSAVDRNASCPFREDLCRTKNRNTKLDTYIHMSSDLGLNTPSDLQFALRIVTHCAPLATEEHRKISNYSSDKSYMRYFYGPRIPSKGANFNYTYEAELRSHEQFLSENLTTSLPDYELGMTLASSYNGSLFLEQSSFLPIDGLYQGDGDMALFFLSANDVLYSNEVNDEWYAAHRPMGQAFQSSTATGQADYYLADEPAAVLGCKMQYQSCDSNLPAGANCSPPGGVFDVDYSRMQHNDTRGKVLAWVLGAPKSVFGVAISLKSSSLASRYSLRQNIQAGLPDNQWQLDVENWHNIVLAGVQGGVVDSATGPNDPEILKYFWRRPDSEEAEYLCKNQKIISTAYQNFSVLGLCLTLILGSLIIGLDSSLESVIIAAESKFRRVTKYARLEWFTNDALQTQRLAHEELGIEATWNGCAGVRAVPITEKGEMLAVLDISDPKHPRLRAPEKTAGMIAEQKMEMPMEQKTVGGSSSDDGNDDDTTSELTRVQQTQSPREEEPCTDEGACQGSNQTGEGTTEV